MKQKERKAKVMKIWKSIRMGKKISMRSRRNLRGLELGDHKLREFKTDPNYINKNLAV